VPFTSLHYLTRKELQNIPFPVTLQREFESMTRSPLSPLSKDSKTTRNSPSIDAHDTPKQRASMPVEGMSSRTHKRSQSLTEGNSIPSVAPPIIVTPPSQKRDTPPTQHENAKEVPKKQSSKGFLSFWKG
jgi:hypothetical protein